ncbi:MAG TPA: hypothetical protein VM694_07360 [Polyangium sp.]|nr:hypothetical protein [Polyangium sp.]
MKTLTVALVLGLCAGCADRNQLRAKYAGEAEENLKVAVARAYEAGYLTPFEIPSREELPPGMRPPDPSTEAPESERRALPRAGWLEQRGRGAPVRFYGEGCMVGDHCGCDAAQTHFFGKASNGMVVVLVPQPEIEIHTLNGPESECDHGCGTPAPPTPWRVYELPVTNLDLVSAVVVPFRMTRVTVACETRNPVP